MQKAFGIIALVCGLFLITPPHSMATPSVKKKPDAVKASSKAGADSLKRDTVADKKKAFKINAKKATQKTPQKDTKQQTIKAALKTPSMTVETTEVITTQEQTPEDILNQIDEAAEKKAKISKKSDKQKAKSIYWQCVTFARSITNFEIRGNAWTWWESATGKYDKGNSPKPGSILVFKPQGKMKLGHVAVVNELVTDRLIQITHANWSPINGRRGQVEKDVSVLDVSEQGDWSKVKVWYGPLDDMGTTAYSTYGFIYAKSAGQKNPFGDEAQKPILIASNTQEQPSPLKNQDGRESLAVEVSAQETGEGAKDLIKTISSDTRENVTHK